MTTVWTSALTKTVVLFVLVRQLLSVPVLVVADNCTICVSIGSIRQLYHLYGYQIVIAFVSVSVVPDSYTVCIGAGSIRQLNNLCQYWQYQTGILFVLVVPDSNSSCVDISNARQLYIYIYIYIYTHSYWTCSSSGSGQTILPTMESHRATISVLVQQPALCS